MAQDVTLLGADYPDVPSVILPKTGGGNAEFTDTSISDNAASASDIALGKKAYVNGNLVTGTAQPMEIVTTNNVTDFLTVASGISLTGSCTTYGNIVMIYLAVTATSAHTAKYTVATLKSGFRPISYVYGSEWNTGSAVEFGTNGSIRINHELTNKGTSYISGVFVKS